MMRCAALLVAIAATCCDGLLVGTPRTASLAPAAARAAPLAVRMQVIDAPVKIPDTIPPDLAPKSPEGDKANQKGKKHKLLLFNDNVNRREYVARVLVSTVPELTQADAYAVMQKAHKAGMAVVGVWMFELCEAYCEGLKAGGLIASTTEED